MKCLVCSNEAKEESLVARNTFVKKENLLKYRKEANLVLALLSDYSISSSNSEYLSLLEICKCYFQLE